MMSPAVPSLNSNEWGREREGWELGDKNDDDANQMNIQLPFQSEQDPRVKIDSSAY